MITTSDKRTHFYQEEMSQSAKDTIETFNVMLASEMSAYLGTLMQAASMKILEVIQNAEMPKSATMEELEEALEHIRERRPK